MERQLQGLPHRIARRCIEDAMQAGGDVLLAAMKALAPERTDTPTPRSNSLPAGFLRADLTTQVQVKPGFAPIVKVGPTKYTSYVAWWIENGWTPTGHGKSRKGRKQVGAPIPGKHFMAASFDESIARAADAMLSSLSESLEWTTNEGPENDYGGEYY